MATLGRSLHAWNTGAFADALKADILGLGAGVLPLREAAASGCIDESDVAVTVLAYRDTATEIQAGIGVFFTEVIAGCSCGDAPASSSAYCELQVCIDKSNGQARFKVIHD